MPSAIYLIFIKVLSSLPPFRQVLKGPRLVLIYTVGKSSTPFIILPIGSVSSNVHDVLDPKNMTQKLEKKKPTTDEGNENL